MTVVAAVLLLVTGCGGERLPEPGTEAYREAVSGFYRGVAALQTGEAIGGEEALIEVTEVAPGEPAPWANLGIVAMRRAELETAAERLQRARDLVPDDPRIAYLLGRLAELQNQPAEAIAQYERALELDARHARSAFALAQVLENQSGQEQRLQQILADLSESRPENVAVQLELAQALADAGDRSALEDVLGRLEGSLPELPEEARTQLQAVRETPPDASSDALSTRVAFLRNALIRMPRFRQDLAAVQPAAEEVAPLIDHFMQLPAPSPDPAPPDTALNLVLNPLDFAGAEWTWAGTTALNAAAESIMLFANAEVLQVSEEVELPFPGGGVPPSPHGITSVEFDYDFLTDIACAGAGGFRLYRQLPGEAFGDATGGLGLPDQITQGSYTGVWAADVDMEGDMDLVLGSREGPPIVLQNNGDGTFSPVTLFESVAAIRGFSWGDLDADGDPDAAVVDAQGGLSIFENLRGGQFRHHASLVEGAAAIVIADVDVDAVLDVVVLTADGSLTAVSANLEEGSWTPAPLAPWAGAPAPIQVDEAVLFAADMDNNGAIDLIASSPGGGMVWLGAEGAALVSSAAFDVHALAVAELTADGRLDLIGATPPQQPVMLVNRGETDYEWKVLRTRAAQTFGDQRINPFGVGGEIEMRAGLLFQKQLITGPITHFGLGRQSQAEVARIIWPNGNVQAEFDLTPDEALLANQRLKGSCPWLFTHDGERVRFITDFMWRSPLGLAINAQESAGVASAEDWVKIRGEELAPRDGQYDVRITAELWESHYFDRVELMVVDHPDSTEIFVDERFVVPPPPLKVHATRPLQPVSAVWDHEGREVTDVVRHRDQQYLGGFELGPYQGVAQDHVVEIDLGSDAPLNGSLLLVGQGWVRPTDSSLNVALSQGSHPPPTGLSIEVPDGQGGWRTFRDGLGFPAGKTKTILLDLEGISSPRLRLRTNLEIYWDRLAWTTALSPSSVDVQRLPAASSELRYRGFSVAAEANRQSPELPDYEQLWTTVPIWRDLEGFHTRFGETTELTSKVDDRYVIMNAGDELLLRYDAPPEPPEGWRRDFVLVGHAWNKDGDLNTTFSRTVLPLPYHGMPSYDRAPTRLEDDPVFQRHPEDWVNYHTRYVTPRRFVEALTVR